MTEYAAKYASKTRQKAKKAELYQKQSFCYQSKPIFIERRQVPKISETFVRILWHKNRNRPS